MTKIDTSLQVEDLMIGDLLAFNRGSEIEYFEVLKIGDKTVYLSHLNKPGFRIISVELLLTEEWYLASDNSNLKSISL